jgi:hypothetical protein
MEFGQIPSGWRRKTADANAIVAVSLRETSPELPLRRLRRMTGGSRWPKGRFGLITRSVIATFGLITRRVMATGASCQTNSAVG